MICSDMSENVRNAQLLLSYASEAGISVEPDVIRTVVEAKKACESNTPPADPVELETKFWQATERLAKSVNPVTVASLRATYEIQEDTSCWGLFRAWILRSPQKISQANRTVMHYRQWTLFTLIFLLIIQVYWVIGSSMTKEIASNLDQLDKAKSEQLKLTSENILLNESIKSPTIVEGKKEELVAKQKVNLVISTKIEADIENCLDTTKVNYEILNHWNNYWRWPFGFHMFIFSPSKDDANASPKENDDSFKKLKSASIRAN